MELQNRSCPPACDLALNTFSKNYIMKQMGLMNKHYANKEWFNKQITQYKHITDSFLTKDVPFEHYIDERIQEKLDNYILSKMQSRVATSSYVPANNLSNYYTQSDITSFTLL